MAMVGDMPVHGWAEQWLDRTHKGLQYETYGFCHLTTLALLVIAVKLPVDLRRGNPEHIEQDPDDPAVTTAREQRLLKAHKAYSVISFLWLFHALAIWTVDAGISVWAIQKIVSVHSNAPDATCWVSAVAQCVLMFVSLIGVLLAVTLLQVHIFVRCMESCRQRGGSTFVVTGRAASTNMALPCAMLSFFTVAWWPPFSSPVPRFFVLVATFGSALLWILISWIFTNRLSRFDQSEALSVLGLLKACS